MEKVEDFSDLSVLTTEKLIKLRDVVWEEYVYQKELTEELCQRWGAIAEEILARRVQCISGS